MKKEVARTHENSYGVASTILGIFSIMFSYPPLYGVILGVIALVFANKQIKIHRNGWSKAGKILAIVGIILSIVFLILLFWLSQNPDVLAGIAGGNPYGI